MRIKTIPAIIAVALLLALMALTFAACTPNVGTSSGVGSSLVSGNASSTINSTESSMTLSSTTGSSVVSS